MSESKQQQPWSRIQSEYREGPTSMMEVATTDTQSEWQPLSLPSNIPDTYDQNMQYTRNNEESCQLQQSQQQDYWNQESYYQSNYGRNDSNITNWQQNSTHPSYPPEQSDIDDSQRQEKWNYEVNQLFIYNIITCDFKYHIHIVCIVTYILSSNIQ